MYSGIEKHEIHCAKRYLDYKETENYRVYREKYNGDNFGFNYAVLKETEDVKDSIAQVEKYFQWRTEWPVCFRSAPDALKLIEATKVFSSYGYVVKPFHTLLLELSAPRDEALNIIDCKIDYIADVITWPERPLVKEAFGGASWALKAIDKQIDGGAKAFFAYNKAGIPISFCLGEGYGSAFCISDVYTPEPCRKQGCATAVLAGAIKYAMENGYVEIFMHSNDKKLRSLYKSLGFRARQTEGYWACKGELPSWIMALK